MYQPLESNSLLSDFFPPRPLYLSPSISRTVQRFTRQCTRYEVLTPFAHTWQATIKDRFEMTQRYRFTLIRDTPVTINYSESVRIYPGLFFFFWKNLSLWNFQRFKLFKLSEIQVLSLSVFTISKCIPSRIEISNFSDFLASNFWKKASICTFSKLSIFPFFFFSISSFSKINFSQILEFLILNYPRIFFFTTSR